MCSFPRESPPRRESRRFAAFAELPLDSGDGVSYLRWSRGPTVDVDTPLTPGDVFAPEVDLADVEAYTAVDNPPLYLQSITYGRRVIFSIESDETSEAVQAALDVALKSG